MNWVTNQAVNLQSEINKTLSNLDGLHIVILYTGLTICQLTNWHFLKWRSAFILNWATFPQSIWSHWQHHITRVGLRVRSDRQSSVYMCVLVVDVADGRLHEAQFTRAFWLPLWVPCDCSVLLWDLILDVALLSVHQLCLHVRFYGHTDWTVVGSV